MKESLSRFAPAGRRSLAIGAASALLVGAVATPAAQAQTPVNLFGSLSASSLSADDSDDVDPVTGPTITVSDTTLSAEGEHQITVVGTGFNDPDVLGTRPPLAGLNAGAYVVFGKFGENWRPSTGGVSGDRAVIDQKWALLQESADVPALASNPQVVVVDADGAFTTTLTVSKAAADAKSETGHYGIYSYAGGGVNHEPYETATPIVFTDGDEDGDDDGEVPTGSTGTGSLGSLTDLLP